MRERRNVDGPPRQFSRTLKRQVIDYYLMHNYTEREVWEKFVGPDEERGRILRWMRQLGYCKAEVNRVSYLNVMGKKTHSKDYSSHKNVDEAELVKKLRKQLEEEKLKSLAYLKMIEIAEKEFKISIRKKSNTKP